jgi:hypothetical protein
MALAQIQIRQSTSAEWAASGSILAQGELGYDTTLKRVKVGDGVTSWAGLGWSTMAAGEVQAVLSAASTIQQGVDATDGALAAALGTPGSESGTKTVELVGAVTEGRFVSAAIIPDLSNSWWSWPDAVYDPGAERYFITGGTFGGAVKVAWWDRLSGSVRERVVSAQNVISDDHYMRALLVQKDRPVVVFGSLHNKTNDAYVDRSRTASELDIMEDTLEIPLVGATGSSPSYGTIIPHKSDASTLGLMARSGTGADGEQWVSRTTDRGATVSPPVRFFDRPYSMFRVDPSGVGHFLAATHTTKATIQLHYFRMDLATGLPVKASGGDVRSAAYASQNFWSFVQSGATPFVALGSVDNVRQPSGTVTQRPLDMSLDGRMIVICTYPNKADMSQGGTYSVLVRQGSDASNTWANETLTLSGAAFYEPSGYVGGACFTAEGDVILCRESGDVWTLERWERSGTAFGPGSWARADVLYTGAPGVPIVRPRSFVDCNNWTLKSGVVTFGEYPRYDPRDFRATYGNQRLLSY